MITQTNTSITALVTIGGNNYELILTTRATREIAARYGGLEHPGRHSRPVKTSPTPSVKSSGSSHCWPTSQLPSTTSPTPTISAKN